MYVYISKYVKYEYNTHLPGRYAVELLRDAVYSNFTVLRYVLF